MIGKHNLIFHHVGCLSRDIKESQKIYAAALGLEAISPIYTIADQGVKVCFIAISPDSYLELVEPIGKNSSLHKLLNSKTSFYHMGFLTDDIEDVIIKMQNENCYLISTFFSEAFENKKCAFLYTSEMHLIELIQK